MARSAAAELVELKHRGDLRTILLRELNSGNTYEKIAEHLGVSELTVSRWIKEQGLEREVRWHAPQRETAAV